MTTNIILIGIGVVFLIIIIFSYLNISKIAKVGVKTEGVVYDLESSDNSNSLISYPIIRFLTIENEWITKTYKIGVFPGFYKKGEKVTVLYNPKDPRHFTIKSSYSYLIPLIVGIIGFSLIVLGIFY